MSTSNHNARRRLPVVLAVAVFWVALIGWLDRKEFKPIVDAENFVQDLRMQVGRKTAANTNLVFLGITQPAYRDLPLEHDPEAQASPALLAMRQTFPWSRTVWAEAIERLLNAGARVVAVDMVFAASGEGDDALRAVLDRHRDRVIIGDFFDGELTEGGLKFTVPSDSVLLPEGGQPAEFDPRVGFVSVWPDRDGVVRRHRYAIADAELSRMTHASPTHESLAARVLRHSGQAARIPGGREFVRFRYTAAPGELWRPIPLNEIFYPNYWSNNFTSGAFFKDKLVIIGPAANTMHDEHPTPFMRSHGQMLGPELHLNILNAALRGEFLTEPQPGETLGTLVLAGALAVGLALWLPVAGVRLAASAGLGVCYLAGSQWIFNHSGHFLLAGSPLAIFAGNTLTVFAYDFVCERVERLRLHTTMGFYFSPRVLEAVMENPGSMEPRAAQVVLLLTDLRNSTPLAEQLGAKGMFNLLNRVFELQTAAVMAEEGNLEHFLGDQFLSYWGAPQEQPQAAEQALRAALVLSRGLMRLRAELPPETKALFGFGVGLHSGPVLVGNKGSAQRLDYGLVGDTVNEASRIEALTKYYGLTLLASGDFLRQLKTPVRARRIDVVKVKGKSTPVELHEIAVTEGNSTETPINAVYAEAFADYSAGRFAPALERFRKLRDEFADAPSAVLVARCELLLQHSPAAWNGVWEMERK